MRFPDVLESRSYGNPEDVYAAKQGRERRDAERARMRAEAIADIASVYKRPAATKIEPKASKPLREFLAEESGPREWSPARKAAEELFK